MYILLFYLVYQFFFFFMYLSLYLSLFHQAFSFFPLSLPLSLQSKTIDLSLVLKFKQCSPSLDLVHFDILKLSLFHSVQFSLDNGCLVSRNVEKKFLLIYSRRSHLKGPTPYIRKTPQKVGRTEISALVGEYPYP